MENRTNVFNQLKDFIKVFFKKLFVNIKEGQNNSHQESLDVNNSNKLHQSEVVSLKQQVIETNKPKENSIATPDNNIDVEISKKKKLVESNPATDLFNNFTKTNKNEIVSFPVFSKEEIQADQLKNAKYKEVITFHPNSIKHTKTTNKNVKNIAELIHSKEENNTAKTVSFSNQVLNFINQNYLNDNFTIKDLYNEFVKTEHSKGSIRGTFGKLKKRGLIETVNAKSKPQLYKASNKVTLLKANNDSNTSIKPKVLKYIQDNFKNKEFKTKDICEEFKNNHTAKTVSSIISRLNKENKIARVKRGYYKLNK